MSSSKKSKESHLFSWNSESTKSLPVWTNIYLVSNFTVNRWFQLLFHNQCTHCSHHWFHQYSSSCNASMWDCTKAKWHNESDVSLFMKMQIWVEESIKRSNLVKQWRHWFLSSETKAGEVGMQIQTGCIERTFSEPTGSLHCWLCWGPVHCTSTWIHASALTKSTYSNWMWLVFYLRLQFTISVFIQICVFFVRLYSPSSWKQMLLAWIQLYRWDKNMEDFNHEKFSLI